MRRREGRASGTVDDDEDVLLIDVSGTLSRLILSPGIPPIRPNPPSFLPGSHAPSPAKLVFDGSSSM